MPSARRLPGERGEVLIASNGLRTEVVDEVPEWATLYWYLDDDPGLRPDWNRTLGYKAEKFNKMSKTDI